MSCFAPLTVSPPLTCSDFTLVFCRLRQVHPDILSYTEESMRKKGVHSLSELEQLYNKEVRSYVPSLTDLYTLI